jgi:AcrR family transcriptional regulator
MDRTAEKPLRADAQRNRDRLLEAAVELFAQTGAETSLEAIAKRAGVGIGTLYRNFPTREALVEAAYRSEVEHLCAAADELLATNPPAEALAQWMERFVSYAATKRGMASVLQPMVASGSLVVRDQIVKALSTLLDAAAKDGAVRSDVTADDVLQATGSIWMLPLEPGWEDRARRILQLLMDGLRYGV